MKHVMISYTDDDSICQLFPTKRAAYGSLLATISGWEEMFENFEQEGDWVAKMNGSNYSLRYLRTWLGRDLEENPEKTFDHLKIECCYEVIEIHMVWKDRSGDLR